MLSRTFVNALRAPLGIRAISSSVVASRNVHTLPELNYDYGELEPVISGRIMEIHHSKHHQTYVNNLNALCAQREELLKQGDAAGAARLDGGLRFNGGGHINHTEFWNSLAPPSAGGGALPSKSVLSKAIDEEFGSVDKFIEAFNAQTAAVQGSGWGWLVYNPRTQKLSITTTPNQDRPEDYAAVRTLLGVDVWEHAYYLDYENRRPDYLKNIWKIINWNVVEERLANATSSK